MVIVPSYTWATMTPAADLYAIVTLKKENDHNKFLFFVFICSIETVFLAAFCENKMKILIKKKS